MTHWELEHKKLKEELKKRKQKLKEELKFERRKKRCKDWWRVYRVKGNSKLINWDYTPRGIMSRILKGIKQRCCNPKAKGFSTYGKLGIKVCERWSEKDRLNNFINDMGFRPSKDYCIHRKDSKKDYCKENCVWMLKSEHAKLTSKNLKQNKKESHDNATEK